MALEPGQKLAHYEMVEPIGKGGMGEVYRALDSKLGREVAIKILPEEFSRDAERLARFKREAKVLASLNHPNIAAIHGLEESEGIHYLVLELVPGETLAERIARGPIPLEEAIEIATKVAAGLEEAHEQGIVHRDLKPANIKLTPDDKVKILDFGLAKAFIEEAPEADDSMSPTITRDATRVGVILGTAAYMSPEQAKGKQVDRRTDIFAFGAVLYEMLTGKKAFQGEGVSETLAAVMKDEPDWAPLPPDTPKALRRILRRCLAKPVTKRVRHIGDVLLELEEPETGGEVGRTAPDRSKALLVAATLVAAGVAVWALVRTEAPEPEPVSRWTIPLPPIAGSFTGYRAVPSVAISPNGRYVAYTVASERVSRWDRSGTFRLYLRPADALQGVPVDGGEGATAIFFSPDSQSLGFASDRGRLMKVSVRGGAPVVIAEFRGQDIRGASWSADGHIYFNPGTRSDLARVAADGGEPEILAMPSADRGEKSYRFVDALPGGEAVLVTVDAPDIDSFDEASIAAFSLKSGEMHTTLEGGFGARYSDTGHLVYARGRALYAVPFDVSTLAVTGDPIRVLDGVGTWPTMGAAEFSLSGEGSLLYAPGGPLGVDSRVVSVDRAGMATPIVADTEAFYDLRMSPDGRSLALSIDGANISLWTYDLNRSTLSRLVAGFNNWWPVWTPDSERIAFASDRRGPVDIFVTAADGHGKVQRLVGKERRQVPFSWAPDGQTLAFSDVSPETGFDIWLRSADGELESVLRTSANENRAAISPDGGWMAYESDESGRTEIYLVRFPSAGQKQQVSIEGGTHPVWNPNGRELFFRNGGKMMAVDIDGQDRLVLGEPRELFESDSYRMTYDVSTDGERFVMIDRSESAQPATELVLVENWAEELKQLVPTEN